MSRDSHRPNKKKELSKLAQSLIAISALSPGLTMVVGQYSAVTLYVHAVMVQALAKQSADLPIPMPDCESVICFFRNTPRKLEQLRGIHNMLGISALATDNFKLAYREASRELDWTSPAAIATLSLGREEREASCIVLQQPAGAAPDIEGLLHLRRAAEAIGAYLILLCPDLIYDANSSSIPNELFVVAPCPPNPGFDEAFVFSCPELASPLNQASGKVLCCVRLTDDGLETEITPYVADDLKTRLMAILKADEWSLEEIGKLVGLNKSNVSRKLRMVFGAVPDGWDGAMLAEWLEACDLDPIDEEDSSAGDSDDEDGDDDEHQPDDWEADDDAGDDLDDLDHAKPVAPASRNERNTRNNDIVIPRKQR
ncbi:hypothetical protein [Acidovorax sp. LjRoot117]|uniref:hypothetical protein n=1 Tax=Acidovorax sp. LjRoot117 TaxID=3342255 RepID=UPI003ECCCE42